MVQSRKLRLYQRARSMAQAFVVSTFVGLCVLGVPGVGVSVAYAAKIACVGDSITFGYGLSNPQQSSYPAVLQSLLGAEHTVGNFGVSGATLLKQGDRPYWNEGKFAESDAFAPDVVVIMLGTNDAKPQNWVNSAEFASDYEALVAHYRDLEARVYLATPPPVVPPGAFEIPADVVADQVVPQVEQVATSMDAPLIDVFQALGGNDALFPDAVHPNAAGAALLAETVQAALVAHGFAALAIAADAGADPGGAPASMPDATPSPDGGSGGASESEPPTTEEPSAGGSPAAASGGSSASPVTSASAPETSTGGVSSPAPSDQPEPPIPASGAAGTAPTALNEAPPSQTVPEPAAGGGESGTDGGCHVNAPSRSAYPLFPLLLAWAFALRRRVKPRIRPGA